MSNNLFIDLTEQDSSDQIVLLATEEEEVQDCEQGHLYSSRELYTFTPSTMTQVFFQTLY
eukprot:scaffold13018_cov65-Cylindrotheca_fusiformis.AAC.2